MKFLLIFLAIAATLTATISSPVYIFEAGASYADRIGSAINKGINFSSGVAQSTIDTARDFATGVINTKTIIEKGIIDSVTGAVVSTFETFNIISRVVILTIKETITNVTNRIVVRAAEQVSAQLQVIHDKASEVFAYSDQKLADVKQKIDNDIQSEEDKLTNWADQKVQEADNEEVSEETKAKITEIVDGIVESWNEEAHECADSLLTPLEELNDELRTTFEESLPIYENVTNQIRECASGDQKNSILASDCVKQIRAKLSELSKLPSKYTKLLSRVTRFSINSFKRAPCAVKVIAKTKRDQMEAEMKIKELILKDKENQSTTESDAGKEVTDETVSTSVSIESPSTNDPETTSNTPEPEPETTSNTPEPSSTSEPETTSNTPEPPSTSEPETTSNTPEPEPETTSNTPEPEPETTAEAEAAVTEAGSTE